MTAKCEMCGVEFELLHRKPGGLNFVRRRGGAIEAYLLCAHCSVTPLDKAIRATRRRETFADILDVLLGGAYLLYWLFGVVVAVVLAIIYFHPEWLCLFPPIRDGLLFLEFEFDCSLE